MSKAYLQPFLIFPDAVLGSMLVTLAGETDATPVYDPNTGSILSQPLEINSVGEVTPFHANDNVLYDLHVFAAGISAVVGNQLYTRENVTVVGGSNGLPGTNGKSVRVQAVTGGAKVYDEFGNTVTVLDGLAGPAGPAGPTGAAGATGATGATGASGADGIAGYIQLPALPVDPSTVPIGQPVILPDGTMWTNVTGSWTALAVSEAMLTAGLEELVPVDAVTDGSTKAVTSNAVFDALALKQDNESNQTGWSQYTNGTASAVFLNCGYFTISDSSDSSGLAVWEVECFYSGSDGATSMHRSIVTGEMRYTSGAVTRRASALGDFATDSLKWQYDVGGGLAFLTVIARAPAYSIVRWRRLQGVNAVGYASGGTTITPSGTALSLLSSAPTAPAGSNDNTVANTAFVGKPSGSVITLSSSQTITPANGAVYYVSGSYDITLSNSSALGTRCYVLTSNLCPQSSRLLYTDVAGNSNLIDFGTGFASSGGAMCDRFASGWLVIGGMSQT